MASLSKGGSGDGGVAPAGGLCGCSFCDGCGAVVVGGVTICVALAVSTVAGIEGAAALVSGGPDGGVCRDVERRRFECRRWFCCGCCCCCCCDSFRGRCCSCRCAVASCSVPWRPSSASSRMRVLSLCCRTAVSKASLASCSWRSSSRTWLAIRSIFGGILSTEL